MKRENDSDISNVVQVDRGFADRSIINEELQGNARLVIDVMRAQVAPFSEFLRAQFYRSGAHLILGPDLASFSGVDVMISNDQKLDGSKGQPADKLVVREEEYGVHKKGDNLRMYTTPTAINAVGYKLRSFFKDIEPQELAEQRKRESAATLIAWMALGKWTIEQLWPQPAQPEEVKVERGANHDWAIELLRPLPPEPEELMDQSDADAILADIYGFESSELDAMTAEEAQRLAEENLYLFQLGFMGLLGFYGLARQVKQYEDSDVPTPTLEKLQDFVGIYGDVIPGMIGNNEPIVRGFDIALAKPLNLQKAQLGLVVLSSLRD